MQPYKPKITYLRLSVTNACNLGCLYCMPYRASIRCADAPLSVNEITALVRAMADNGVTKVRFTGGEPLVRDDLLDIVGSVAGIPGIRTIGVTTNGTRLAELSGSLKRCGVTNVNVSLDSLNHDTFQRITGRDDLDRLLEGLHAALDAGFEKVKINTVVMRDINHGEVRAIADLARKLPVDVRFIELMPLGHTEEQWARLHVPASEIREMIGGLQPLPYDGVSSARLYSRLGSEGRIGIISPMSEHFCAGCNRIRVTASGVMKPCLRLPVEQDVREWLGRPDLSERLGALVPRLSRHKLSSKRASSAAVQAETMCAVGG